MLRLAKHMTVIALAAALVAVPLGGNLWAQGSDFSEEEEIGFGAMAADLLLVRPVSILGCIVGGALFVVSIPFAHRNIEAVGEKMVSEPIQYTFNRKLGDF